MSDHATQALFGSDAKLVERTRSGERTAFAELWRRHYRSGSRVARQFSSSIDADDLVAEAFMRIYERILAGGGPTSAFRPYLYATIRNIACSWGAAVREVGTEAIEDFADENSASDPIVEVLDRTFTAVAFRSLPKRWQDVLWYTEVEGMDPHEVAPLLGMTANSVAALAYRAREGLRRAWLQAHVNDQSVSGECRWVRSRIGQRARRGLTAREVARVDTHVSSCVACGIIDGEVADIGSRLALVLIPGVLGGAVGGAYLASLGSSTPGALAAQAIPAFPGVMAATGAASAASAVSSPVAISILVAGVLVIGITVPGPMQSQPAEDASNESSIGETASPRAGRYSRPDGAPDAASRSGAEATADPVGDDRVDGTFGSAGGTIGPGVLLPGTPILPAVGSTVERGVDLVGDTVGELPDITGIAADTADELAGVVLLPAPPVSGLAAGLPLG